MNTNYTVIRPDGTELNLNINLPAAPTLQALRSLIVPHLDDEPEPTEEDAEPEGYPFQAGDWRSDERDLLLERRYVQ